jgi:hypothetical protein
MRGLAGLMMSLLALAVAVPGVAGAPSLAGAPCAAATAQTLVSIDGNVAERISATSSWEAGRSPTSTRSKKTARC